MVTEAHRVPQLVTGDAKLRGVRERVEAAVEEDHLGEVVAGIGGSSGWSPAVVLAGVEGAEGAVLVVGDFLSGSSKGPFVSRYGTSRAAG